MRHDRHRWRTALSAAFLLGVLGMAGFGLYQLAGRRWRVQPTFNVRAQFQTIGGIEPGSRVRIQGMDAGVVERVIPPSSPGMPVELVFRLDEKLWHLIRSDATAKIMAQGFVGLKIVEIVPGLASTPLIEPSGLIRSENPPDLAEVLASARRSLDQLDKSVREAEHGIVAVNALIDSISRGEGSLGRLVRDDSLAKNLVSLSQKSERTLLDLQENLDAVKHTWPVSRYFDNRAYFDQERLLYQPNATKVRRSISVEDAFEPGRSVLTAEGKKQLDEVGRWCQSMSRPNSEVVIAAFSDEGASEEKSRILTQAQAEAVRSYLVQKYAIDSAGWFRGRKVAAVGFGTHLPEIEDDGNSRGNPVPRRVDILVFTPQT